MFGAVLHSAWRSCVAPLGMAPPTQAYLYRPSLVYAEMFRPQLGRSRRIRATSTGMTGDEVPSTLLA